MITSRSAGCLTRVNDVADGAAQRNASHGRFVEHLRCIDTVGLRGNSVGEERCCRERESSRGAAPWGGDSRAAAGGK
jgi:hypothetical protein